MLLQARTATPALGSEIGVLGLGAVEGQNQGSSPILTILRSRIDQLWAVCPGVTPKRQFH